MEPDQDFDPQLEDELRRALHRVAPPEGFAERVLRAAHAEPAQARVLPMPGRPSARRWIGGALAAALLAGAGGAWAGQEHRRRQQLEADRQFTLALEVTSRALEHTRTQLSRTGLRIMDSTND